MFTQDDVALVSRCRRKLAAKAMVRERWKYDKRGWSIQKADNGFNYHECPKHRELEGRHVEA